MIILSYNITLCDGLIFHNKDILKQKNLNYHFENLAIIFLITEEVLVFLRVKVTLIKYYLLINKIFHNLLGIIILIK